jgi:hypothetical protein
MYRQHISICSVASMKKELKPNSDIISVINEAGVNK